MINIQIADSRSYTDQTIYFISYWIRIAYDILILFIWLSYSVPVISLLVGVCHVMGRACTLHCFCLHNFVALQYCCFCLAPPWGLVVSAPVSNLNGISVLSCSAWPAWTAVLHFVASQLAYVLTFGFGASVVWFELWPQLSLGTRVVAWALLTLQSKALMFLLRHLEMTC